MAEAMELDAVDKVPFIVAVLLVTSDCKASEPVLSPAPVRFRDPNVQISRAEILDAVASCLPIVPGDVRVDDATFQTSAARVPKEESVLPEVDQTLAGIVAKSEEDAVRTVALVLLLIVVTADETCEFVLAFTSVVTLAIPVASDVEAFKIEALVLALTSVVTFAIPVPNEVEALSIVPLIEEVIPDT